MWSSATLLYNRGDIKQDMMMTRREALFNAFGSMKILCPSQIKRVDRSAYGSMEN